MLQRLTALRQMRRRSPTTGGAAGAPVLTWATEQLLEVGGTRFHVTFDPDDMHATDSTPDCFLLGKAPWMIKALLESAPSQVRHIVDLGIFKGGSVALYDRLFSPARLVAIEVMPQRVEALDSYVRTHSRDDQIRLYYGVDQADRDQVGAVVRENFDGPTVDLVIDDCSHLYGATIASLNTLLPWIRPGGMYVIEDWGWAHWPTPPWQGPDYPIPRTEPALTNLVFEVVMLQASRPDLVSEVLIHHNMVMIVRGDGPIKDADFDLSTAYLTGGREFRPAL